MRKIYVACLFVVLLIVTFSAIANAAQFRRGKHIIVPKDEVIEDTLYVTGESLTIEGTITGDLISYSRTTDISGTVKGDLITASRIIDINGTDQYFAYSAVCLRNCITPVVGPDATNSSDWDAEVSRAFVPRIEISFWSSRSLTNRPNRYWSISSGP